MGRIAARTGRTRRKAPASGFAATPLGSTEGRRAYVGSCRTATSASAAFNDIPTITDKLQVFGDIRVGTTGTNGCLKNFAGDRHRRHLLVGPPLQERHHAVRPRARPAHGAAAGALLLARGEFPSQHFGDGRAYGLIAQDVEQVLPELVVTDDDGFKAVDYSKLPLLTIQAVKELKAENDALKQRVSELERLVNELLAASSRR